MRADQFLVEYGIATSRSQAQRLIAAGARWLSPTGWRDLGKSDDLPPHAQVELLDDAEARYVSRGGLKLQGALQATGLQVSGWHCLDVGQSTGGFTDCLLQHGAAQVTGVDVGHGQLHPRLRDDGRVRVLEGVNARYLKASALPDDPGASPAVVGAGLPAMRRPGEAQRPIAAKAAPTELAATSGRIGPAKHLGGHSKLIAAAADQTGVTARFDADFDLIVGDLSFISLTLVLSALAPLLKAGGHALLLVKPQFELQPAQIAKGGIVRDAALYTEVEQRLRAACAEVGWTVLHWLPSAITGGDGNREFFIHAASAAVSTDVT